MELLNQNVKHYDQFEHKKVRQVNEDIPWFVIGSVRVIFVVFQFLYRRLGDSGSLFFRQQWIFVIFVRCQRFMSENDESNEQNRQMSEKAGFFDREHQIWPFRGRLGFQVQNHTEKRRHTQHIDERKHGVVVNSLRPPFCLCVLVFIWLKVASHKVVSFPGLVHEQDAVN